MFKFLRILDRYNPEAHRVFVELTDRLEEAEIFQRSTDLDISPTSICLSRRRGQWEFHWCVVSANPKHDGVDTIDLFLGKLGSFISTVRKMWRQSPLVWNHSVESTLVYADAEFRDLVGAFNESSYDHSHWLISAKMLGQFFLKQRD